MTPVNGADVRMLRALLAARGRFAKAEQAAVSANAGSGGNNVKRSNFDVASFLEEWHVAEEREQGLWWSFQAAADVHMNTALPYDLNALKVRKGAGVPGCLRVVYMLRRSSNSTKTTPAPSLWCRAPSMTMGCSTEFPDQAHVPWISQGNACGGALSIISFRSNRGSNNRQFFLRLFGMPAT